MTLANGRPDERSWHKNGSISHISKENYSSSTPTYTPSVFFLQQQARALTVPFAPTGEHTRIVVHRGGLLLLFGEALNS